MTLAPPPANTDKDESRNPLLKCLCKFITFERLLLQQCFSQLTILLCVSLLVVHSKCITIWWNFLIFQRQNFPLLCYFFTYNLGNSGPESRVYYKWLVAHGHWNHYVVTSCENSATVIKKSLCVSVFSGVKQSPGIARIISVRSFRPQPRHRPDCPKIPETAVGQPYLRPKLFAKLYGWPFRQPILCQTTAHYPPMVLIIFNCFTKCFMYHQYCCDPCSEILMLKCK